MTASLAERPPNQALVNARTMAVTLVAVAAWFAIYSQLLPFSVWAVAQLPLEPGSRLADAIGFFIYDTPKVLMLLGLVVFAMGMVRSFFSPERTRALLAGRREGVGNVAAAGLGIFTPFCSCSAVPLFVGFVSAGVPLGVTFSFLIAAPMINEVALARLIHGMAGNRWRVSRKALIRLTDWVSKPSCPREQAEPHPPCPRISLSRSLFQRSTARSLLPRLMVGA